MSDNPFESPPPAKPVAPSESFPTQHDGSGRSFVRQIGVVGGLMIGQGVLLLMFAIFCIVFTVFFANIESMMPAEAQQEFQQEFGQEQVFMLTGIYGVWGVISLGLGILYVVAGIFNLGFKGRVLGIVTLFAGMGSIMTCYCAPTAIALAVYGLIIFFNPAVAEAFRLRRTGLSKQQVLSQFTH